MNLRVHNPPANLFIPYLGIGNTEHLLCEAILLYDLENRHIELPILLPPPGVPSRPVLVAHLLQGRELSNFTSPKGNMLIQSSMN